MKLKLRTIAFLGALFLIIIGATVAYKFGGLILVLIVEVALVIAICVLRQILIPPWAGKSKVKLTMLYILSGVSVSMGARGYILLPIISFFCKKLRLPIPAQVGFWHQLCFLSAVGVIIIIIAWLFDRNKVLSPPEIFKEKDEKAFKKLDYLELRDRFCKYMISILNKIDDETNWSDSYFTKLEAEIEMVGYNSSRSKVVSDLIKAICRDNVSRSFLIIGDPGSGKSVSLRRLARTLYSEVNKTGIVPIYINLKEWDGPNNPTDKDIADFAYRYLLRLSGRAGKAFLENWYESMLSRGLFFFLLDSFDEIPMVLDCDDKSEALKRISNEFDKFFHDIHECRGVLSSRPFRQPTGFRGRRLTIRPFTETQIRKTMKKGLKGWDINSDKIVRSLLIKRPELASAIRNPFMADLIIQYIIDHPNNLPLNYFELFDNYINKRLNEDYSYLSELRLSKNDVIKAATKIAQTIYNTANIGLEADFSLLRKYVKDNKLDFKIRALQNARIGRYGGRYRERFSFVHRRFAEFFAVRAMLSDDSLIKKKAIPEDSRWRDGLVVYCGIASEKQVRKLAEYAWSIIKKQSKSLINGDIIKAMPAIHCLRFLKDACQSRVKCISSFQNELSQLIGLLIDSKDLLVVKTAAGILPIVTAEIRNSSILKLFKRQISWLSEAALRSCRHLTHLEGKIIISIRNYIKKLSTIDLFLSFNNIDFNLSLSDSLRTIRLLFKMDILLVIILWCLLFVFLIKLFLIRASAAYSILFMITVIELTIYLSNKFIIKSEKYPKFQFLRPRLGFDSSIRYTVFLFLAIVIIGKVLSFIPFFSFASIEKSDIHYWYRNMILMILLFIFSIPSDFWYNIFKFSNYPKLFNENTIKYLRKFFWGIFKSIILGLAMIVLVHSIQKLKIIKYALLGVFIIFFFRGLYLTIPAFLKWIKALFKILNDRKRLERFNFADEMTWEMINETLKNTKSDWGKSKFFKLLLANKVRINQIQSPPDFLFKNQEVKEYFARFKEYVYNLEE